MRIGVIVFFSAVMLTACAHMEVNKNVTALKRIQTGDTQEAVFKLMGQPVLRHEIGNHRFIAFYQTKAGQSAGQPVTTALCTPIAFQDGRVVAVGEDLTEPWTREELVRQQQAEIVERERQRAEMAEISRQKAETARQEKIAALEKAVKPVPASNAALNLKLYHQLLELDPRNSRYQEKVKLYEERLVRQENANKERAHHAANIKRRQEWEQTREARNKKLRQYSGNGIAEMAVHDMGNGSLYVWVKNVSRQVITTHPDHFILVDSERNPARCEISDTLNSVLEPGGISHGRIEYNREIVPGELIFQNRESGRISKSFH